MNRALFDSLGIRQAELAKAAGLAEASVSRLLNGTVEPNKSTIDAVLAFFSKRLDRVVTYEEAFGSPKRRKKAA